MSTYNSPVDVVPLQRARSATINNLDAAVAAAFALLPHEDELTGGTSSWGTDTGTVNTYLVELPYEPTEYIDGLEVNFRPLNTNTGASTINVNSLGVKNVKRSGDLDLYAGDLSIGLPVQLRFSTVTNAFHFTNTIVREGSVSGNEADITANAAGVATNAITTANFDTRNDRDDTAITLPAFDISGGAVDHTLNTDGSADISLDWTWTGTETDIDGFIVYVRGSSSDADYIFGTTPAEEVTFHCMADRRSFILKGIGADLHWTFGVSAYRIVDPDVAAEGKLASVIVQPSLGPEDPYQPSANIAFGGDVTGTVNSQSVSAIIYHNGSKLVTTDDGTIDADDLDESVTKKWAAETGADVTAASNFVTITYPDDQSDVQDQIDGKIDSWFQDADPSGSWAGTDASHEGDMWWTLTSKKLKRYSGTAWSADIEDQKAIDAYSNAATAQDTADGKRRVFVAEPTTPYDVGDLWAEGFSGDIKKCKTARSSGAYQSGDWELASEYDATNYTDNRIRNGFIENETLTILRPGGATYSYEGDNDSGAIVITLPQSWSNTMISFAVDVYQYITSKSFTLHLGGYNRSSDSKWMNKTANLVGSTSADNRVRFGHDGTKCCIVIGDTGDTWVYPKVTVRNFQAGYSSYTLNEWDDGWVISTETDLSGYTFTGDFSDALIDANTIKNQGDLATQDVVTASQVNTSTLSAITANCGTINAGILQNSAGTLKLDLTNGKFTINLANGLEITSAGGVKVTDGGDILFLSTSDDIAAAIFKGPSAQNSRQSFIGADNDSEDFLIMPVPADSDNIIIRIGNQGNVWKNIELVAKEYFGCCPSVTDVGSFSIGEGNYEWAAGYICWRPSSTTDGQYLIFGKTTGDKHLIYPHVDSDMYLGINGNRFYAGYFDNLYGTLHDIELADKTCTICGKAFKKDDHIKFIISDVNEKSVRAVPVHEHCEGPRQHPTPDELADKTSEYAAEIDMKPPEH